ncbi:AIPR family protein [Lysobacter humi (ex Lee et al. 2017)]
MGSSAAQSFLNQIALEVDELAELGQGDSRSELFTSVVLDRLEEAGHFSQTFCLYQEGHFGNAIYRIDGFAMEDDADTLDLFTTIYKGDSAVSRISSPETAKAAERALRFARAAMEGLADKLEPSNTDASDFARSIQRKKGELRRIRIVVLTDGEFAGGVPQDSSIGQCTVEYVGYDIVRLHRVLGEGETRADISVDVVAMTGRPLPALYLPSEVGGYDTYLTAVPGDLLSKVYDLHGTRLLELNVRAFLGIQGRKSVNAELRRTIVEKPSMFLAFNNGLVATVDEVDADVDSSGLCTISKLNGLQIVNGGQTTASLHRARRKESIKLDEVLVPAKIIRARNTDLDELVTSVSKAANRQNSVQPADFSANDPFHQQVENAANNTWLVDGKRRWFYERARGGYLAAEQKAALRATELKAFRAQSPKARRLSKLDLARYMSAWEGLPFRVCMGGQKNFQLFMQRIKDQGAPIVDESWFKKLVALAILYRTTERIVRALKLPAYRAQIVSYMIAGLSHRTGGRLDFDKVWEKQSITPALEAVLTSWAPEVDRLLRESAGQRNPGEWFKKADCWEAVRDSLPTLVDPLPAEIAGSAGARGSGGRSSRSSADVELAAHDLDRVAQCMLVDSHTWLRTAELGQQSGVLHWKMAGICRTLASYAAGSWLKKPSAKQAKFALEALAAVEAAGLLQPSDAD